MLTYWKIIKKLVFGEAYLTNSYRQQDYAVKRVLSVNSRKCHIATLTL